VNVSVTGSTTSKAEDFELISDLTDTGGGLEDVTSTTALAGSFVSDATAAGLIDTSSLVTDAAPSADTADAEVH